MVLSLRFLDRRKENWGFEMTVSCRPEFANNHIFKDFFLKNEITWDGVPLSSANFNEGHRTFPIHISTYRSCICIGKAHEENLSHPRLCFSKAWNHAGYISSVSKTSVHYRSSYRNAFSSEVEPPKRMGASYTEWFSSLTFPNILCCFICIVCVKHSEK
jgi:hypothetical protein